MPHYHSLWPFMPVWAMEISHLIYVLIITASVYGQRLDCFLGLDQNGHHFAAEIVNCTYVIKKLVFYENCNDIYFQASNWQLVIVGLGNCMALFLVLLSQCFQRGLTGYGVIGPQWANCTAKKTFQGVVDNVWVISIMVHTFLQYLRI